MVSSSLNRGDLAAGADLLVAFVNTRDLEEETDALAEPEQVEAWIAAQTGDYVPPPEDDAHARFLALREALRALLRANNGGPDPEAALDPLREAAERSRYRTEISPAGELQLLPARSDLSGFEARLVLALERLQSHGLWPRLKACTEDGCQWAFLDTTRNRSRTWCSMEECGNRDKTRRYRSRRGPRPSR
jgi:predicted RNA-binding Zn ribbon-like protein